MALSCGADLVLELPLPWAISSAQEFARGGVAVLQAAGADTLICGSESGQEALLHKAADCLRGEAYRLELKRQLSTGVSFAAARQAAVAAAAGEQAAALLSQPNDLLAVSYLEAMDTLHSPMSLKTVKRTGPAHNGAKAEGGFASASAIRTLLEQGDLLSAAALLPQAAQPVLLRELQRGAAPASLKQCERSVLYRLRQMTPSGFAALPDCSEGLENRLYQAAQQAASLEQFYDLAKTKRYPLARIRRLALWAFLGMTGEDRMERPPCLRVLGMNSRGQQVLRQLRESCPVPVITKPASAKKLAGEVGKLLELESRAADLWQLCLPRIGACGTLWRTNPVIMR
jgi:predicted nucleotidyltransferase